MASGNFNPGAGENDGIRWIDGGTPKFDSAAVFASLSYGPLSQAFIRLPNVAIPRYSTITSAVLTLKCYGTDGVNTLTTTIHLCDEDDAAAPTDVATFDAKVLTTASVDWTLTGWSAGNSYASGNLAAVLQEVVDRAGWSSGNAVCLMLMDGPDDSGYRQFYSFNAGSGYAVLAVTWTPGVEEDLSGLPATVTVSPAADGELSGDLAALPSTVTVSPAGSPVVGVVQDLSGLAATVTVSPDADGELSGDLAALPAALTVSPAADDPDLFRWANPLTRFVCVLIAPGLPDLEIPIKSLSARVRNGSPSYLQVVTPGLSLAADIAARIDGRLIVYRRWQDAAHVHDAPILWVDLEEAKPYEGANSQSISLTGHQTITFSPKAWDIAADGVNYRELSAPARFRCGVLDPEVRPGDAVTYDGDTITVGAVSYNMSISENGAVSGSMEISEEQEGDTAMASTEHTGHTVAGGVVPVTEIAAIIGPVQLMPVPGMPGFTAYYANDSLTVVCEDADYLPAIVAAGQGAAHVLSVSGAPVLSLTLDDYDAAGDSISLESHSPTEAEVDLGLDAMPPVRPPVQWQPPAMAPYTLGPGPSFVAPYAPTVRAVSAASFRLNHYRYFYAAEIVAVAQESWVHLSTPVPAIAYGDMVAFTVGAATHYVLAQQIEWRKSPTAELYQLIRGQWCEGFVP